MVFVFAVAAIAGIISSGSDFPMNPFTASYAFFTLNKVSNDQAGKRPIMMKMSVLTYTVKNAAAKMITAFLCPTKMANVFLPLFASFSRSRMLFDNKMDPIKMATGIEMMTTSVDTYIDWMKKLIPIMTVHMSRPENNSPNGV